MKKRFNVHEYGAALVKSADVAKLPPKKIIVNSAREMREWVAGEIKRIGVRPFARQVGAAIGTVHESKMRPVRITLDELAAWGPALGYRLIMSVA